MKVAALWRWVSSISFPDLVDSLPGNVDKLKPQTLFRLVAIFVHRKFSQEETTTIQKNL
jgi:hypothetical protein